MTNWDNLNKLNKRDRCVDAVRAAMRGMRPEALVEMANDDGPTDLTPFCIIADAAVDAARLHQDDFAIVAELRRALNDATNILGSMLVTIEIMENNSEDRAYKLQSDVERIKKLFERLHIPLIPDRWI